jgi:hypothetical protein
VNQRVVGSKNAQWIRGDICPVNAMQGMKSNVRWEMLINTRSSDRLLSFDMTRTL